MSTSRSSFFEDTAYEEFRLGTSHFQLSENGIKLLYLLNKWLGPKKYADDFTELTNLLSLIADLINECNDINKLFVIDKAKFTFFTLATLRANQQCLQQKLSEKVMMIMLNVLLMLYKKIPSYSSYQIGITFFPEEIVKFAIEKNHTDIVKAILIFSNKIYYKKMFQYAIHIQNRELAIQILTWEQNNRSHQIRTYLSKFGAFPLQQNTSPSLSTSAVVSEENIKELSREASTAFPNDSQSSDFNILFPFCNEQSFNKIFDHLAFINELQLAGLLPQQKNNIPVALVFGESHFLSLLLALKTLNIKVLFLADIVMLQQQHLQHMLATILCSTNIEEYKINYLTNNPIQDLPAGHPSHHQFADIEYLKRNSQTKILGHHHFLSSEAQYQACKEALREIEIVFIKFDLLNEDQCALFSRLLKKHAAELVFCNFTNIHDYDEENKLHTTIPRLLGDSYPYVAYSTDNNGHLKTTLRRGGSPYLIMLQQSYLNTHGTLFSPIGLEAISNQEKLTTVKKSTSN